MSKKKPYLSSSRTSEETSDFYDRLMRGDEQRGILGKDSRYNPQHLANKASVIRYYDDFIAPYLSKSDKVLDFGCGPGTFSIRTAMHCKSVTGVDISAEFVAEGNRAFSELGISNAKSIHIVPDELPFDDKTFDAIIMVDVIHHLDKIEKSLDEAFRVVKSGGKVIIFEPNKLNPLIWLVHLVDPNERGLLSLGTPWKYHAILQKYTTNITSRFNGIVIGPQSRLYDIITSTINSKVFYWPFGWLNPKIVMYAVKK